MKYWKKIRYNPETNYWFIHRHYYLKNIFIVITSSVGVSRGVAFEQHEVTIKDDKTNKLIGYAINMDHQTAVHDAYKREEINNAKER